MIKFLYFSFVIYIVVLAINAQQVPNVQTKSLRAPGMVVIDGRFKEWGTQFEAYNHATEIYYTMSNDDDRLYLVVQVISRNVINKILRGGLTLEIQKKGKKDTSNAIAITCPVLDVPFSVQSPIYKFGNPDTSIEKPKDFLEKNNKLLKQHVKFMGIKGISGVDPLISVYTGNGIESASLFDINQIYTIELCVPLKYLGLWENKEPGFAYHIILNGYKSTPLFSDPKNMDGTPASGPAVEKIIAAHAQSDIARAAKTDFWGEYTLAKK
jgi:hypothetical protein